MHRKLLRLPKAGARGLSLARPSTSSQFSQELLVDNGDIALGEIPDALKYERPHKESYTSNGIRVMTEKVEGSALAAVSVTIGAGSRHEKFENSGEAHFLEHLHFKGTGRRSRLELE